MSPTRTEMIGVFIFFVLALVVAGCVYEPSQYSITYRPVPLAATNATASRAVTTNQTAMGSITSTNRNTTAGGNAAGQARAPLTNPAPPLAVIPDVNEVAPGMDSEVRDQGTTPADRTLIRLVREAWADNFTVASAATAVKMIVNNGRVILTGAVPTMGERSSLEELARNIPGVRSVENQLEVKSRS